jgi:hypothetical protein
MAFAYSFEPAEFAHGGAPSYRPGNASLRIKQSFIFFNALRKNLSAASWSYQHEIIICFHCARFASEHIGRGPKSRSQPEF